MSFSIVSLLDAALENEASDIFIRSGAVPHLRVKGDVLPWGSDRISEEEMMETLTLLFNHDKNKERFIKDGEVDTAYQFGDKCRFRCNIFMTRERPAAVLRLIPNRVPTFAELGLPREALDKVCGMRRGLVLVTGITGSGKSTTLSAVINHINDNYARHIVTLEDPVEFVYEDSKSVVNQREIGTDSFDFHLALRNVVRQSPDVILLGEMRDQETMEAAIAAAETGHLVFSTLHTTNATQTVERIIQFFPPHQHEVIRMQLSLVMQAVVSQRLIPKMDNTGRAVAVEVMMHTPRVAELLLGGKTHELVDAIQESSYYHCQTFNQHLFKLYSDKVISEEDAMANSDSPDELKLMMRGISRGGQTFV
jgi:twitching motility protein PilT